MRPLAFVDLDDTLFCAARKSSEVGCEPVAYGATGSPQSFMSAKQRRFFENLSRDADLVPTTGRTVAALKRVRLPLGERAICSHGGIILGSDGRAEPEWAERILLAARHCQDVLHELCDQVRYEAERVGCNVRARVIVDDEIPLYVSVKHEGGEANQLREFVPVVHSAVPAGWRLIQNGNNVTILPPFLGKEQAVAWFLENRAKPNVLVLGVGDSLSDVPFLALCDFALMPVRSQLFAALPRPDA